MSVGRPLVVLLGICGIICLLCGARLKKQIIDETILTVLSTVRNQSLRDASINDYQGEKQQTNLGMKILMRVCSQRERLNHMKKICDSGNWINQTASHSKVVDDKHRVLVCLISKVGGTALKALFLEANGYNFNEKLTPTENILFVHSVSNLSTYGLHYLDELPKNEQMHALESYFKFSVVRHPFDRLLSVFRGKVLDPGSEFSWFVEILNLVQPKLFDGMNFTLVKEIEGQGRHSKEQTDQRKKLREPTFAEFLIWLKRTENTNAHFADYQRRCGYCGQDWDAIIRLETIDEDKDIIIKALDYDVKDIPVRHSHQEDGKVQSHFSSHIAQFSDVPGEVVDYFLDMHAVDMEMFGYKWDRQTNRAYCQIETEDGGFCC